MQPDDCPLIDAEVAERAMEVDQSADAGSGIHPAGPVFRDVPRGGEIDEPRLATARTLDVPRSVDEDPPKPRDEAVVVAQPGQILPCPDEGVLGHVVRPIGPGDDQRQPMEIGQVEVDQSIEGFTVAPGCASDKVQRFLPRSRQSRRPRHPNRSVGSELQFRRAAPTSEG